MTTFQNQSGSKAVNINSNFRASYVQIYNGEQQVLQVKCFSSMSSAEKWAKQKLS